MEIFSKHNILNRIQDSDEYILINPLYNQADIITADLADQIIAKTANDSDLRSKKYIVNAEEESKAFKHAYLDFIDQRDTDEVQIFFVPSYACNFACSYCYQSEYNYPKNELDTTIIDAFFSYIRKTFIGRDYYVTLFGGEPLLMGQNHRENILYFLSKIKEYQIPLAVVTNGYTLTHYADDLALCPIKEIQVTLDGPASVHNSRRKLHSGESSFTRIVEGVNACLNRNLPVNLRVVVDKENLPTLADLAQFAIEQGWTSSPLFKTQLGRNYELHYCQEKPGVLYDRVSLYEDLYKLLKKHPEIAEFHKPAFSVSKFLFENGELPSPLFDSCPGCKTEWAFDYSGQIYSCTATVGKPGEELGRFYPEEILDENKVGEWQNRDVLSIAECKNCNLQLACGGGCASVAKNNKGSLACADCRPVNELMSLGAAYYFNSEEI